MSVRLLVAVVRGSTRTADLLVSSSLGDLDMNTKGWDTVILSEPDYEHLVAELHYEGQFLLLLDREQGRESICVAFPTRTGELGPRIALKDFIRQLEVAAEDLKR